MKVALVYDRVNKIGGAERILVALHELYPQAPLFTLVYEAESAPWSKGWQVQTSFLQQIPFARRYHEFFPIIPIFAVEQFDFSGFDLVISITATEAKGIITGPSTLHISYILTPTRYLWSHYREYFTNRWLRYLSLPAVTYLRLWDQLASKRPDVLVAISNTVRGRIKKYYQRDAKVIYPPVDLVSTENDISNTQNKEKDYFLVVSRLVRYKRIEIAIEACNQLQLPLIIIGEGLDKKRLMNLSGPTIQFMGNLTDWELASYYQNCRALLFPQEEDFGIVVVEALRFGKPVIAYRSGGATEIIIEGKNGEFFYPDTSQALEIVLEKTMNKTYSQNLCQKTSRKFSKSRFKKEFKDFIEAEWAEFKLCQN